MIGLCPVMTVLHHAYQEKCWTDPHKMHCCIDLFVIFITVQTLLSRVPNVSESTTGNLGLY